MLQHALQAAGGDAGCRQRRPIEEIGLQPAQLGAIGTMHRLGALNGLTAEVQPNHLVAEIGEQGHLMAPAAAGDQHPSRRLGCSAVSAQKGIQRRRGLAQLPAIIAVAVALIPGGSSHQEKFSREIFNRSPGELRRVWITQEIIQVRD